MRLTTKSSGFTLIELVVVVGVAGMLAAAAIPSFITFVDKIRLETAASDIVSVLKNAREKAVSEDVEVSIVQDSDSLDCNFASDSGAESCLGYSVPSSAIALSNNHSFTFQPTGRLDFDNPSITVLIDHSDISTHRFEVSILSSGRVSVRQVQI